MTRQQEHDVVFYVPTVAPLLAGDPTSPPGGAETQVRLIARELAARDVRVAMVAYPHPGLPRRDGDVTVVARAPHSASPAVEAVRIGQALRQATSRVVVTRQAGAHTAIAAVVARGMRRRFVYSAANVIDFDFAAHEPNRAKSALFALGLRLAGEIVAQTDEQRELCARRLGRAAPVIRSIAEPAPPRTGVGSSFLWAGRVVDYKQPLAFLDLAQALPEAHFTMVAVPDDGGDPGQRLFAQVQDRAARLANLRLLPPCSRGELLRHMEDAVAVVSTSRTEGMPNVWLEGWSRGIPALTLEHDPDALVRTRGLGASAEGDFDRFAAAARDLWERRDDLAELAQHCLAYVQDEHSPEAVALRWKAVLAV